MFKFFKPKCPICKMELKEGKDYPEGYGKKFYSDNCQEEYRKRLVREKSKSSGGYCH